MLRNNFLQRHNAIIPALSTSDFLIQLQNEEKKMQFYPSNFISQFLIIKMFFLPLSFLLNLFHAQFIFSLFLKLKWRREDKMKIVDATLMKS